MKDGKFENLKMRTFKNLKKKKNQNLYFLFSVLTIQNVNINKWREI